MNDVVYAIPGLMPPPANNWCRHITASEDGSIKLCVHCGAESDKVYYALDLPGWDFGFIKDPQYFIDKGYPEYMLQKVSEYRNYLTKEHELPTGVVIPKITINGWPIPITERKDIEDKYYWILNLPKFVLPPGDTIVSVSTDARVRRYVVTRPDFSIHKKPDITPKA